MNQIGNLVVWLCFPSESTMPCCCWGADGARDARKKRGKSGVFKVCNMLTMPAIFPSIGATFGRLSPAVSRRTPQADGRLDWPVGLLWPER